MKDNYDMIFWCPVKCLYECKKSFLKNVYYIYILLISDHVLDLENIAALFA